MMMENNTPLGINIDSRHLQAFFDFSSDGLLIFDGRGKILAINRTSERFNGFKASEIAGKNIRSLVDEGYIDRSATQEVIETKRQVSIIQYIQRSGYQLLVTGIPVFDDKEEIEFIIVNERDMSLLNNMRKELEQTRKESDRIREELTAINLLELSHSNIVAESDAMKQTLKLALKLSRIDASNILITGESGTGKGLLAKLIHKNSPRSKYPFIQINCAALPENLLEAELFGYEPGAFSGASEKGKAGLFELASRGTIFLDEIGELPFHIQAKLLKYLDDHEVIPLGGTVAKTIKCSVIAATNRDLEAGVIQKSFRLDLLYRLNTFTLNIPPLRKRPEDILELVKHFLDKYNKKYRRRGKISSEALERILSYHFPGNVRELINIVKKAVVMSEKKVLDQFITGAILNPGNLSQPDREKRASLTLPERLHREEKKIVEQAAQECRTTREMASFLGISQPGVVRKLKKHQIRFSRTKQ